MLCIVHCGCIDYRLSWHQLPHRGIGGKRGHFLRPLEANGIVESSCGSSTTAIGSINISRPRQNALGDKEVYLEGEIQ